ncbi:MAG: SDR family NAD(P)-dependent oxidoreductase [Pseudomonadota bacterium]
MGSSTNERSVCAILGAGDGLGQSLASKFATHGFDIALLSRSKAGSQAALDAATAAAPEATVQYYSADAMSAETVTAAFSRVAEEMGAPEVMIYNARGDMNAKPPLEVSFQDLRDIFELEVVGAYAAAKAVMPKMIERGHGTVIFSSATAALRGSGTNPLYAIGKFGLRALSQNLTKAYGKDGVHVAHVRLDCALDVPVVRKYYGDQFNEDNTSNTDDVAESYFWIHQQPKSAWSNEVEIRPYTEDWTY